MKDVGLRIRIQRDLREAFLEACRAQDKPAAQVLREFMREYVAEQGLVGTDDSSYKQQEDGKNFRNENRRVGKRLANELEKNEE